MMHPRFLAAIDFSESSYKALTLAAYYARHYHGTLHVVHAIYYPGNALAHERQDIFWEKATAEANDKLAEAILDHAPGLENVQTHLVEGQPEQTLLAFADVLDADILFVGTQGFRLSGNPFIGSSALGLLRHHRRPLMLVSQLPAIRNSLPRALVPVSRKYGVKGLVSFLHDNRFQFQAEFELLHLVTEDERGSKTAAHFLERKTAELQAAGGSAVSTAIAEYHPDGLAASISQHMHHAEKPFAMICVEGRDHAAFGEMLVGGGLEDIILHCKRPVLSLRTDAYDEEPA
jgi:nucleotide-binding universal stress UspA family protein